MTSSKMAQSELRLGPSCVWSSLAVVDVPAFVDDDGAVCIVSCRQSCGTRSGSRNTIAAVPLTRRQAVNTWSTRFDTGAGPTAPTTIAPAAYRHICSLQYTLSQSTITVDFQHHAAIPAIGSKAEYIFRKTAYIVFMCSH